MLGDKKVIEYAKQYGGAKCGPFTILNVLKWIGAKRFLGRMVNRDLVYNEIASLCNCDGEGTYVSDFEKVLNTIPNIEVRKVSKRDVLERHLDKSNNAAIVLYGFIINEKIVFHFVLFVNENNKIRAVNYFIPPMSKSSIKYANKKLFDDIFNSCQKIKDDPEIWLITKRDGKP